MCQILPVKAVRISENRGSFFERDTVLFEIANGLPDVPGKHILYIHELRWLSHYFLERLSDALSGWRRCRQRRRGGGELGAQAERKGHADESSGLRRRNGPEHVWAARRQDPLEEQRVPRRPAGLLADRTRSFSDQRYFCSALPVWEARSTTM